MTRFRRCTPLGQPLQFVIVGVDADMRVEQKQVDAVEPLPIDFRRGGAVEHGVEVDWRVRGARFFADQAGPGGVVQFGVGVGHGEGRRLRVEG